MFSVFVFLPAVGCAQDVYGLYSDCGFPPALAIYTVDRDGRVSPDIVKILEDGQNCLNVNLIGLKASVESLHTQVGWNADDMKDMRDELKQAELDRHTAETKIETLEDRLSKAEGEIQELKLDFPLPPHRAIKKSDASKPKAPASKPTAPVTKPAPAQ